MDRRIFVTSDMHLAHTGLSDDGFRPKGFSELIVDRLGMLLNPTDLLIDLGDVCWGDYDYWFERLSHIECTKWLVRGNHDKKSIGWYMDRGYHSVTDGFRFEMFGRKIFFSHYPVRDDGWFDLNIHGHFHNFGLDKVRETEPHYFELLTPKHKLVALEALHFEPVKLQRIVEEW
jgi:calcineurin-like phosphoesterase family protein